MKNHLKGKSPRDHALFVVGLKVALRITDLLNLTWGDILESGKFNAISLKEGKTKKDRRIKLNRTAQKALSEQLESIGVYSTSDYIFRRKAAIIPLQGSKR